MRSPGCPPLAALLLALAACHGESGTPPTAPVATANVASTTPPGPPPILELKGTAAFSVTGPASLALTAGAETTVEVGASFRVELPVGIADARLSLLDAGDAMLPCSGTRQVGQATVLTLSPAAPLRAGAQLRLRVDGAATRELHAADGRRFAPLEWPLAVAGTPEPRKPSGRKGPSRPAATGQAGRAAPR